VIFYRVSDMLVPPAVVIHFPVPTRSAFSTLIPKVVIQRLAVACPSANTNSVTFLLGSGSGQPHIDNLSSENHCCRMMLSGAFTAFGAVAVIVRVRIKLQEAHERVELGDSVLKRRAT
jgi:hypothetical protein